MIITLYHKDNEENQISIDGRTKVIALENLRNLLKENDLKFLDWKIIKFKQ